MSISSPEQLLSAIQKDTLAAINAALSLPSGSEPAPSKQQIEAIKALANDKSSDPSESWIPFKNIFDAIVAFPNGRMRNELMKVHAKYITEYVHALETALSTAHEVGATSGETGGDMTDFVKNLANELPEELREMLTQGNNSLDNLLKNLPSGIENDTPEIQGAMQKLQTEMQSIRDIMSAEDESVIERLVKMGSILNQQTRDFYRQLQEQLDDAFGPEAEQLRGQLKEWFTLTDKMDHNMAGMVGRNKK